MGADDQWRKLCRTPSWQEVEAKRARSGKPKAKRDLVPSLTGYDLRKSTRPEPQSHPYQGDNGAYITGLGFLFQRGYCAMKRKGFVNTKALYKWENPLNTLLPPEGSAHSPAACCAGTQQHWCSPHSGLSCYTSEGFCFVLSIPPHVPFHTRTHFLAFQRLWITSFSLPNQGSRSGPHITYWQLSRNRLEIVFQIDYRGKGG